MLRDLLYRLRSLFRRRAVEAELDDELRVHLDYEIARHIRAGASPEEAFYRARLALGGLEQVKEECRDARGVRLLETLLQDLGYTFRALRHDLSFTVAAILTLALGIGASTAVFSVINAVLLKPLPYPHPEQIVFPWRVPPAGVDVGFAEIPWSRIEFITFQREAKAFAAVGAFQAQAYNLTGAGDPAHLQGILASAGFFPAVGVAPELGRTYTAQEDTPGHGHEVVLSDRLWRERFGADASILGRSLDLNGEAYTVIGVMPPGFAFPRSAEMPGSFSFPREPELWVPLALDPGPMKRGEPAELAVIGRLKPGITVSQAQAEMDVFEKNMQLLFPQAKDWFHTRVAPMSDQVVGSLRRPLWLLLGAVGVVLLIACSNVANLLLTRCIRRRKEFTMRAALGAGRARLIRQLLTESLSLSLLGAAGGLLIASPAIELAKTFGPTDIPRLHEITLDLRVLLFALAVCVVTGIVFGLAPALAATRSNLVDALKSAGQRSGAPPTAARMRHALLIGQFALALVLVIAAGLLLQTFFRMLRADGGFNPSHALTFEISLPPARYPDQAKMVDLYSRALRRLQAVPGVQAAGIGETVPLGGSGESTALVIPNYHGSDQRHMPFANYTIVSPGYFAAAGTPLLRGRAFQDSDQADSPGVAIVNRSMAAKFWPGQDAIGKQVRVPIDHDPKTVIGIVADVKHLSLREDPGPEMYVPYTQKPWPSMLTMQVVLRTQSTPAAIVESVRAALHSVDPDLPLAKLAALSTLVDASVTEPRFSMLLLGSFAALALLLASVGMYGVVSYSVAQRTQEIGIRMALGLPRGGVLRMLLGQAARLAGVGILVGLAAAAALTRLMAGFLYGIGAADPLTFAAVALTLTAVALLASYVPARRASKIDPVIALRYE